MLKKGWKFLWSKLENQGEPSSKWPSSNILRLASEGVCSVWPFHHVFQQYILNWKVFGFLIFQGFKVMKWAA